MDIWTVADWVGRGGFVAYFVMSGINHLVNHKAMAAYAQSKKVPLAGVVVVVTALMMFTGSAMILLHWHPIRGAAFIVAYVVPTAFFMHNYWAETDAMMKANQLAHFWKNITIAGGAVLYAVATHQFYR